MTFAQCWCYHNSTQQHKASIANSKKSMNPVFANQNEEDAIYPLTTQEIAEAQQQDNDLKKHRLQRKVTPYSWSKTSKYSVTRAKWLYQNAYNTVQ